MGNENTIAICNPGLIFEPSETEPLSLTHHAFDPVELEPNDSLENEPLEPD